MIIRHGFTGTPESLRGAVAALGNFDGVHRGHCAVLERAGAIAREAGKPWGVVTFEPHPREFFQASSVPFRLTPFRQKARLLAGLGLDLMISLRFDRTMAGRSAQDFVVEILVEGLGVSHVITGPSFVFGRGRRGNGYVLGHMAAMEGFGYTEIDNVAHRSAKVSSTDIRVLLRRGQVDMAADLLGHLWEFEGRVQHGDRRGRAMGFPTANLTLDDMLHPGPGIYAVRAGVAEPGPHALEGRVRWYDGAAYIGTRPTFDGKTVLLETNLFDFDDDLYGKRLRVAFVERVRKDLTFAGMDELARQMAEDCARAREVLARLEGRSEAVCGALSGPV